MPIKMKKGGEDGSVVGSRDLITLTQKGIIKKASVTNKKILILSKKKTQTVSTFLSHTLHTLRLF